MKRLLATVFLFVAFSSQVWAEGCNSGAWRLQLAQVNNTISTCWAVEYFKIARMVRVLEAKTVLTKADLAWVDSLAHHSTDVAQLSSLVWHVLDEHAGKICDPTTCLPES